MPFADPEKKREYNRAYRKKHRTRLIEYGKTWRALPKSQKKLKEYNALPEVQKRRKEYDKKGAQKRKIKGRKSASRKYYLKNRPKILFSVAIYQKKHPDKIKLRRYLRRTAAGKCSAEQLRARVEFFGSICVYCGKNWLWELRKICHIDHAIPLARGGTNWPANLRPACAECNYDKGAQSWKLWPPRI